MPPTFHLVLAFVSSLATLLIGLEAGWRALSDRPSSMLATVLSAAQLIALGITSMVGLALVAGGDSADDGIHYLLAVLALAIVPGVSMFTVRASQRARAAGTSVAAFAGLAIIWLLFQTG